MFARIIQQEKEKVQKTGIASNKPGEKSFIFSLPVMDYFGENYEVVDVKNILIM